MRDVVSSIIVASATMASLFSGSYAAAQTYSSAEVDDHSLGQLYESASTAPQNIVAGGARATLQYAASANCFGLACSLDGPAVGAYIGTGSSLLAAEASIIYHVGVVGPAGFSVPILVSGLYTNTNRPQNTPYDGGTATNLSLTINDTVAPASFEFVSACYDYDPSIQEQGRAINCGSGSFSGSVAVQAGHTIQVSLTAGAARAFADSNPVASSAYIDPYLQIDPLWAATHAGYSLAFDEGVGNGIPGNSVPTTPIPEPQIWLLMTGGLAALAMARRNRVRA